MRKVLWTLVCVLLVARPQAKSQTAEVTQLILNIEKLDELRKILEELKKGYEILEKGYNTIKNLSEGNFKLHQAFLDGLLKASPAVKNYVRVQQIISAQLAILQECRKARNWLSVQEGLDQVETQLAEQLYAKLSSQSLQHLDALLLVLTEGKLRASDDERLKMIDQIHQDVTSQLTFLKQFNGSAAVLSAQRRNEQQDAQSSKQLFGIEP